MAPFGIGQGRRRNEKMIIAFDPGHNFSHYAIWSSEEERVVSTGKVPRKDLNFFVDTVHDLCLGCVTGIFESQYVQMAKTKATMAGIGNSTLKVARAAGNIEAVMHMLDMEVVDVHPKTWQAIFTKLKGYKTPIGSKAVKKASMRLAAEWYGKVTSDEADAVAMLYWYLGKDEK
jgi:hypothetical protein